jgi:hypothetical protein
MRCIREMFVCSHPGASLVDCRFRPPIDRRLTYGVARPASWLMWISSSSVMPSLLGHGREVANLMHFHADVPLLP